MSTLSVIIRVSYIFNITLIKKVMLKIFNTRYNSHTDPLFKTSGILKLADIYTYNILVFMYDYSKSKLPRSFNSAFRYNREIQAIRLTRQCDLLHIARCHSSYAKKMPLFSFPRLWNKWFDQVNSQRSRAMLKKHVKTTLLAGYQPSVKCKNTHCSQCN